MTNTGRRNGPGREHLGITKRANEGFQFEGEVAPEGRKRLAQGASPGKRGRGSLAPEGRQNTPHEALSPLRGSHTVPTPNPRLTPWAMSLCPSGAQDNCLTGETNEQNRYFR